MPRVLITPHAIADLDHLVVTLGQPAMSKARVQRSLRILERFPLAGRQLPARWHGARFLIGPWPWMILRYHHDESDDAVCVIAVHDGRKAGSTGPH